MMTKKKNSEYILGIFEIDNTDLTEYVINITVFSNHNLCFYCF